MIEQHALIAVAALLAAGVTFFSGFGLGTALLPAFAAFLPTDAAVAAIAIVHLLNNALKFGLLYRYVAKGVFLKFGLPALAFAPLGAFVLDRVARNARVVDVVIAVLLGVVGVQQLVPALSKFSFDERFLVPGGAASGFLGGVAGLQGALRSAFLVRAGLDRDSFLATGVAVALVVDVSRIATYAAQGTLRLEGDALSLAVTGVMAASVGALVGNRLLRSVTIRAIEVVVGVLLVLIAIALGAGLI
ncbi:MAG TPA: TSUP family transporter [Actinomycetota bacterium]|nr:TSUP family transporter [Actinomycetota bacterium]